MESNTTIASCNRYDNHLNIHDDNHDSRQRGERIMTEMNTTLELVTLNDNDVPTTTSLKVAEAFGKRHDHVMDTMKLIVHTLKSNNLNAPNFRAVKYTDKKGELRPMYEMDRNAYTQLVGSFTGEKATIFRKRYADAFDAMEKKLMEVEAPFNIPETYAEALSLAADQAYQLGLQAPKVEAYDDFLTLDGLKSYTDGFKSIGLHPRLMIDWLREIKGHLCKAKGINLPKQRLLEQGLFKVRIVVSQESETYASQGFLTEKGLDYYASMKRKGEIPPAIIVTK